MRALQTFTAAFCLSCVCAEMVSLLVGSGWARRCIKTLAGVYILVVFLQLLPTTLSGFDRLTVVQAEPVQLSGLETQILSVAQSRLEQEMAAVCCEKYGVSAAVSIQLEQNDGKLQASQVVLTVPEGSDPDACRAAAEELRQQLGVEPVLRTALEEEGKTG